MPKDCSDCTICHYNHLYVLGHNSTLIRTPSHSWSSSISKMEGHNDPILRFLRIITIISWVAAFPFLLVHGISTTRICPVLGIAPMTFSAVTSLVHLAGGAKNRFANIFVDLFCGSFLIGVLIPGWIMIRESGWRSDRGIVMVGTYGTVPMMLNFVIHCWFVLREIRIRNPFQQERCPHCYGDLANNHRQKQPRAMSHVSSDGKESYEPVHMVDADEDAPAGGPSYNHHDSNQPRPSTDDETARLV